MLVPLLRQLMLLSNHFFQFILDLKIKISNIRIRVKVSALITSSDNVQNIIRHFFLIFSLDLVFSL